MHASQALSRCVPYGPISRFSEPWRVITRARSVSQAVVLLENVAQPPLMLFMNLHGARKQIIGTWIVRFVSNPCRLAHLLNHDQQVPVRFFDHVPHCYATFSNFNAGGVYYLKRSRDR